MTVQTYSELKTRVGTLIARNDLESHVQDWVEAAERAIVEGLGAAGGLRVRETEKYANNLTPVDGEITIPSDFVAPGELRLADDLDVELHWLDSKQLFRLEDTSFGTGAGYWTIIGTKIIIRPKPADSQTYFLKYFFRPAALMETSQETNEIFPVHADLYVEGTMWQAYDHVRNTEQADRRLQKMLSGIEARNARWLIQKQGSGSLRMCPPMIA